MKKSNRTEILYTRINKDNMKYVKTLCSQLDLSKSAFLDNYLTFLRTNRSEETRNKVQRAHKATSRRPSKLMVGINTAKNY